MGPVMIWKEYGKVIRRLWLNLFGAAAFGLMLSSLSTNLAEHFKDKALLIFIVSGLIGAFFYLYLLYLVIWEEGAKDRIRVDGGRLDPCPHRGLSIALFYSIPALSATGLYLICTILYNFRSSVA